ncbi:hypothetical protein [Escherichia coli]|uniref:F4 family fimbrial subunit n=1 Tax=Escherichia coli TaxID=562 RepID=UPI001C401549|nr:hypothetical protein [Escherichia coli]
MNNVKMNTSTESSVQRGRKQVSIAVNKAIPVLGIRNAEAVMFQGAAGITPQIDYHGVIDTSKFSSGVAPLTLELKNADDDSVIGMHNAKSSVGLYGNIAGKLF